MTGGPPNMGSIRGFCLQFVNGDLPRKSRLGGSLWFWLRTSLPPATILQIVGDSSGGGSHGGRGDVSSGCTRRHLVDLVEANPSGHCSFNGQCVLRYSPDRRLSAAG